MISPVILLSASWVTLVCEPQTSVASDESALLDQSIILSYLQTDRRPKDIVVIREDGSQSEARWRGLLDGDEVELRREDRISYTTYSFLDPRVAVGQIAVTRVYQGKTGHVPITMETAYKCAARIAERTGA